MLSLDDDAPVEAARDQITADMNQVFRPEFLNRLDEVLLFRRLSRDDMGAIVTIQIAQLQKRLADRGIKFVLDDAALDWLAGQGYDPQFGARPLQRVIQNNLQNPLAKALLDGKFDEGDEIAVKLDEVDQLSIRVVINCQIEPFVKIDRGYTFKQNSCFSAFQLVKSNIIQKNGACQRGTRDLTLTKGRGLMLGGLKINIIFRLRFTSVSSLCQYLE